MKDDFGNALPWGIPALALLAAFVLGVAVGLAACNEGELVRQEAVKAGVAYYQSNTNTGEAVFTWKTDHR